MAIDPRHLRTYLEVCRGNSISEAARRLNISQPSVSVAIAQLEHAVGARLFERGRGGIQLTPTGTALRRRAEALENLLAVAQKEARLIEAGVAGPLVIGGTPGALASLVPKAVALFKAEWPRFDLEVLERPDRTLVELLRGEQIDLALVTTGAEAMADDMVEEAILRDPFALIVGRENAGLPARISLRDVSDCPWVLPQAQGAFRRQVDALFVAADTPTPANLIRCDSLLTTKAIVGDTDYITILPRQVVAAELSIGSLRAIEIADADFIRSVGVRRLTGRQLPLTANAFLSALKRAHGVEDPALDRPAAENSIHA